MRIQRLTALALVFLVAGCDSPIDTPDADAQLEEVRRLTAPYASISRAQAAGYTVWSPDPAPATSTCPSSAEGLMGYHLVNVGLRGGAADPASGDAVIDYRQPEMLLYQKLAGGELELVGVEYLVFTSAWERVQGAGAAPPEVFGEPLLASNHTFAPGGPGIDHYELHVWLHSSNPNGMFSHWNPSITC